MIKKYTTIWCDNLTAPPPCGIDVSFEEDFDALRSEVEKETSLHGGSPPDWEEVLRLASNILSTQSKDIWAICYGIRAALALKGLAGCCEALNAANAILEEYWDDMYPSLAKESRRCAPFVWLSTKMENLLPAENFPSEQADTLSLFKTELKKLQNLLDTKLEDRAPSFNSTLRAIPEMAPPAESQKTTDETASGKPAAPVASTPHVPPPSPLTASELLKAIDGDGRVPDAILPQLFRATQEQAQQLAIHYLTLDMTDWRIYLLHRTALWTTLNQLPQANADRVTQLRPIPRDRSTAYLAAVENRQYAAILPQLERSAGKAPFWFDGHYLVVRCLEALNAQAAKDMLCGVLKQMLRRYPDLLTYKFYDNTPFASEKTLTWIEELLTEQDGDKKQLWSAQGAVTTPEADELLSQALETFKEENSFERGLFVLGNTPAGRNRPAVLHGLLKARYCLAAGKPKAAIHLLNAMYSQLSEWNMLDWEPELTAALVSLLGVAEKGQKTELPSKMLGLLHWLHLDTALGMTTE